MRTMNHLGTKVLEDDRLILRRFRMDDAQAMFENWCGDPEVTKFLMWPPHESAETSKKVLGDWISRYAEDDFYQWAITLKEDGDAPIGTIGVFREDDEVGMAHIGYSLGKRWWGQGIMSAAFRMVIVYLFAEVHANRIEARHDPRNPNSGKVMLKCGLKYEGTLREADRNNQGVCDAAYYAILAKDYFGAAPGSIQR